MSVFFLNLWYSMTESSQKENLGIVVSYKVKVRLILGFGSGWVVFSYIQIFFSLRLCFLFKVPTNNLVLFKHTYLMEFYTCTKGIGHILPSHAYILINNFSNLWHGKTKVITCCTLTCVHRDLCVELRFTLTHPKPAESPPPSRPISVVPKDGDNTPVDTDLIQLDTK